MCRRALLQQLLAKIKAQKEKALERSSDKPGDKSAAHPAQYGTVVGESTKPKGKEPETVEQREKGHTNCAEHCRRHFRELA